MEWQHLFVVKRTDIRVLLCGVGLLKTTELALLRACQQQAQGCLINFPL